jgi:transposase
MTTTPRPGLTYDEIAQRYGRSLSTIKQTWAKHPNWPAPIGKRGRALEFDADQVHALAVAEFLPPPPPEGDPDELLTLAEIADRIGQPLATLEGYAHRRSDAEHKHWPRSVHRHGVRYWIWGDVADHLAARRRKPVTR